jgi:hypothetical protein
MQKVTKVIRMCAVVAITCLVALVGSPGAAQEDKAVREVYQAQAMGQGTQLGKTFNVTINIERYATPEERQILLDAFKQAGSLPACQFTIDKKTGEIVAENYQNPWKLRNIMDRSKD